MRINLVVQKTNDRILELSLILWKAWFFTAVDLELRNVVNLTYFESNCIDLTYDFVLFNCLVFLLLFWLNNRCLSRPACTTCGLGFQ